MKVARDAVRRMVAKSLAKAGVVGAPSEGLVSKVYAVLASRPSPAVLPHGREPVLASSMADLNAAAREVPADRWVTPEWDQ